MTDDEGAIRDLVETWMRASKDGDTATVLDLMTDDVLFLTPGREPFGKEEFAANSDAMKDMHIDGRAEVLELRIFGDWAYVRNHIALTVTPPQGVPVQRSGHTLTVLRKEADGMWRLARDANLIG